MGKTGVLAQQWIFSKLKNGQSLEISVLLPEIWVDIAPFLPHKIPTKPHLYYFLLYLLCISKLILLTLHPQKNL